MAVCDEDAETVLAIGAVFAVLAVLALGVPALAAPKPDPATRSVQAVVASPAFKTAVAALDREHDRHATEIIVTAAPNLRFVGHSSERTITEAIDSVIDKLERQVVKAKERLKDHHARREKPDRPEP